MYDRDDWPGPDGGGDPVAAFEARYPPEVLAAIDDWSPRERVERPLPSRMVRWSRGSLMGAVVTGWALGIQEVLEPRKDEAIVIEVDADGQPHDLPIRLFLDPDDPSGSLCIIRRDPPPPTV